MSYIYIYLSANYIKIHNFFIQIKDLPMALFQSFENFTVAYHVLGRDVKFKGTKTDKFRRIKASKYKPMSDSLKRGNIGIEDSCDSDETESNASDDQESKSDRTNDDDVEETLIVGDINVKKMRVSYVLIPGDSVSQGSSDELHNYFNHHRHILIVLCGQVKPSYQVNVVNKLSTVSSMEKIAALENNISEIKKRAIRSALSEQYSHQNYLQGVHKIRTMRKSQTPASPEVFSKSHNCKPRIFCAKTDQGQSLPPNAIAYAYVDYYQFLNDTVSRVDVTLHMIYSLVNIPKERSVPKMKVRSNSILFLFYHFLKLILNF